MIILLWYFYNSCTFYFGAVYIVSVQSFVSRTPAALPCAPVAHSSEVGSSCVNGFPCSFFSCLAAVGAVFSLLSERRNMVSVLLLNNQNNKNKNKNKRTNRKNFTHRLLSQIISSCRPRLVDLWRLVSSSETTKLP